MIRLQSTPIFRCCAAITLAAALVGCAALKDNSEQIIRVQASQNPVKAARLTLLGVKAMNHGDVDAAMEKFHAAVLADKTYGPAHNNIGLLHYDQGNLYQAVLAFEQAMDLMPQDPIVLYNLALTLESGGRVYEAMDLYWQAVEMDPENPHFLGNLVRLRRRLGEDGDDVVAQLQDLALIETRPEWRRWADRQLALELNGALDRGPETPEFNTRSEDRRRAGDEAPDKVIDLTPSSQDSQSQGDEGVDPMPSSDLNRPAVQASPLPVHKTDTLEELPLSIHPAALNPDP